LLEDVLTWLPLRRLLAYALSATLGGQRAVQKFAASCRFGLNCCRKDDQFSTTS
jgi:hypothetical protein